MRTLVIGREPNLFDENSEAFRRVREYAELFDEYHVINTGVKGEVRNYGKFVIWPVSSRFLGAVRLGRKIVYEHAIGVVTAQDAGESGLNAYFLSKFCKIPLCLQLHTDVYSPWYRRASWKERIRYWLARFLIPRADCIRVVSERIRDSISRSLNLQRGAQPPKIFVLPIFTDISKFLEAKPNAAEERFRNYDFKMLAVGRLVDKEKNFSMLIEMMRGFVKICPRALLVIVGEGPDRASYQLLVTAYRLDRNVIIEGWCDDLPGFYKSFDVYLMPSNYEGWGRTVIEAMASGLPVVMTNVGLAGEVVRNGENGIVIPVGDRRAFFEAVVNLYKNPEKRVKLSIKGQATIKSLRPVTKGEYLALYKNAYFNCYSKSR